MIDPKEVSFLCSYKVESLIFWLLLFQVNSFRTLFSLLIISTRALVTREECLILDIAEVLEIVNFPSTIKSCILHNFSTLFYFPNMPDKVFYYKINIYLKFLLFGSFNTIQTIRVPFIPLSGHQCQLFHIFPY